MTTDQIPLSHTQMVQLTARLHPSRVSKRKQGGRDLSYLEAWDVRNALIRIFGFGGWSGEVVDDNIVQVEKDIPKSGGGTTNFRVTVKVRYTLTIHQTEATYTESAAASQAGADIGEVTDFAIKTAASDAFKRCAMNLGTQFGLSLYDNGSTADVVKIVLAPSQRWPRELEKVEEPTPEATPENAEGKALVERALKMADERDAARAPQADPANEEAQATAMAEAQS